MGSHAVAKSEFVLPMPPQLTHAEAATLPVAFLTAQHSLDYLARLSAGEVLLVHGGAAEGVGLAAITYATQIGAEVIATAGTPEKRDMLRLLGVAQVLDSRAPDLADEVLAVTGGRGVDVVLNSLAGQALTRSLELLRPHGRFIELGKRDLEVNSRLLMRPLRENVSMFVVDVGQLLHRHPELAASHLAQVRDKIWMRNYHPLPHRLYPAARIGEAFTLLQRSRHIGKVVVSFDEGVPVEPQHTPISLDPEATYLVTGGLSGFGAATASWLAQRGARHLALVSRSGPRAPQAVDTVEALGGMGVTATAYAADIRDGDALQQVLASVEATGHPLRGVIHAAAVFEDAPIASLTVDRFRTVADPKIAGARMLDSLTELPLDFFILYSSAMASYGNLQQANYAAGNLYLEALARARRHCGKPAMAVAWSAIQDTGYVARNASVASGVVRLGTPPTPATALLSMLDDLIAWDCDVVIVGRTDWDRLRVFLPRVDAPRFSRVALTAPRTSHAGDRHEADEESGDGAPPTVEDVVSRLVADSLHTHADRLDRTSPLRLLGMDSLMSAEIQRSIRLAFDTEIPMQLISIGSVKDLACGIQEQL